MIDSRVILIAYVFPPLGGSGVFRTIKFVKYLPQVGWDPVVVCGDHGRLFGLADDPTLLHDVPREAHVIRTRFVSPYGLRARLRRLFHVAPSIAGQAAPEPVGGDDTEGASNSLRPASELLVRLGRLLAPLEHPPIDAAFYWALSIVPLCCRLIEEENIDVIYTSSSPYSDHITGWILKLLTGKPWVADFRDPWTQVHNYKNHGLRRSFDLLAEQCVLRGADRVIAVTPSQTQGLRNLVPKQEPLKFTTIENGFDLDDFVLDGKMLKVPSRNPGNRTVLSYVGINREGTAIEFLDALARLGPAGKALTVRFVGGLAAQELAWLQERSMDARVEVIGRVPHPEAVQYMQTSDVLLMILGDGARWKRIYPGKLFEYMAARKPVILTGPEGDASDLLEVSGIGVRLPLERPDEALSMLRLLAADPSAFRERYYHPKPEIIARYDRRALTERLAAIFDELVQAKDGG